MALVRSAVLANVTIACAFATVATANAAPAAAAHAPVAASAPAVAMAPPAPVRVKPVVTHKPTPKPTPKPVVHHVAPKPSPTATHRTTSPSPSPTATRTSSTSSLTPEQRMMRAVAQIPGYRSGDALWVMRHQSSWGLALMGGGTVYISTTVPADKMYDVVSHEWSHLLSVRAYSNDVNAATSAMNDWFGGTGLTGSERAADCMAKLLGAHWTNYTPCTNTRWIAGAKRLVAGQRL